MTPAGKELGLIMGTVLERDDPEGLGRVKVRFPTLEKIESDWIRVLVPYGGHQWIPEVDDEVVIAFEQGNPEVAVVMGTVHSKAHRPPAKEKDERVLRSRGGHTLLISDAAGKERIELRTAKGQHLTLDEEADRMTLQAKKAVVIEAASVLIGEASAEQHAVLGDKLNEFLGKVLDFLGDVVSALVQHTHGTAVGPSSPPLPPPVALLPKPTTLRAELDGLLSRAVKLRS